MFLFRHGETANAKDVCLNGHYDVGLSEKGLQQASRIAKALEKHPIRAAYSSDLKRASHGARMIAEPHGLEPVILPELRELSFGKWEGMSLAELNEKFPGEMDRRIRQTEAFRADGGESFQELSERVVPKFQEIVARHPGETIAMVCHGGVNRAILAHVLQFPLANLFRLSQSYAAVNIIQFYKEQVMVELLNGSWEQIP